MLIGLFVTCIVLTLSPRAGQANSQTPAHVRESGGRVRPNGAVRGATQAWPSRGEPREESQDLYSLRARRRFAAYLRMRLLEMREAGLERAADAVERRLPADALVP